jgi:methyltransferase-like protein/2-polyprenyl-3-methyl-5-hydroxy-6-metoxy-1,4-benzoquinol methylase
MSENVSMTNNFKNSYDETPYESYPYTQTSPYHLKTLAKLFGLESPLPETAKILELGCAGGGNLIPHATLFPKAKFVGIDLSQVQIDAANKMKHDLGLENIEFKCESITDVTKKDGKFDYIICHGVMSWVPDSVQKKIFEICQNNLSENGIAYISYNTLPGWNMIRTIRDMMLYHAEIFADVKDKIQQSRLLLNFIKDSLEGSTTPYAGILKAEAELLSKQSDHYIRHEHLEEENTQFYFKEFMSEAAKHNLQYLGDTVLSSMYLGNMPKNVVEKLATVKDIVRTEQYMDFITNRRFRSTLLCHNSVKLNRNINTEDIKKFYTKFHLVPETPITKMDDSDKLNNTDNVKFYFKGDTKSEIGTTSSYLKAIFYTYSENPNHNFSFEEITKLAAKKLPGNPIKEVEQEFLNHMMRLVLQGYVGIALQKNIEPPAIERPKLSKFAEYQATKSGALWLTNAAHEIVSISAPEKLIFSYMNGKNNRDKIVELINEHVAKGEINLAKDNKKIEDPKMIKQELTAAVDLTINKAKLHHLLV